MGRVSPLRGPQGKPKGLEMQKQLRQREEEFHQKEKTIKEEL
jgi:hypothetical protein